MKPGFISFVLDRLAPQDFPQQRSPHTYHSPCLPATPLMPQVSSMEYGVSSVKYLSSIKKLDLVLPRPDFRIRPPFSSAPIRTHPCLSVLRSNPAQCFLGNSSRNEYHVTLMLNQVQHDVALTESELLPFLTWRASSGKICPKLRELC
jgi:hypothetical protein